MVNLIFEGIDKAGKTTLIAEFVKRHPEFNSFHIGEAPKQCNKQRFYKDYFNCMSQYLTHDNNIIFDRFHLGELVYGKLYRNYEIDYFKFIEHDIKNHSDTILVLVIASSDVIKSRFDNNGIMPVNDIQKVIDSFNFAFAACSLKKMIIDTSYYQVSFCVDRIEKFMRECYGFSLPSYCYVCGIKLDNDEIVELEDYKLRHKSCLL